jgi:hypothetical protein
MKTQTSGKVNQKDSNIMFVSKSRPPSIWNTHDTTKPPQMQAITLLALAQPDFNRYFLLAGIEVKLLIDFAFFCL